MKKILCVLLALVMLITFCACNYNVIDTNWEFNYAYITLPTGEVIEEEIKSWTEDDNCVTIQGKDGQVYCVSYHNVLMTKDKWDRK